MCDNDSHCKTGKCITSDIEDTSSKINIKLGCYMNIDQCSVFYPLGVLMNVENGIEGTQSNSTLCN